MKLTIIAYQDLLDPSKTDAHALLQNALLNDGLVALSGVPGYLEKCETYLKTLCEFSALPEAVKQQYAPDRDAGQTEGYELGAEWFKNHKGEWQIDDKKASYYAFIPENVRNIWPKEIDLKTPYLALGELIFETGKKILHVIGLDERMGLNHAGFQGYGRMLHYHKVGTTTDENPDWCGAHLDHSLFTGLLPAYYYRDGQLVDEPAEAGLYIVPTGKTEFEKVHATDRSLLLFQVGEFGQIASNDRIKATRHIVKKAKGEIDRYTLAVFFNAADDARVKSTSVLCRDERYANNVSADGSITFLEWANASFERYRALNTPDEGK